MKTEIEKRTRQLLAFAQRRLGLPDIVLSTYVDAVPLWRRKKMIGRFQREWEDNIPCYDLWGWLVSSVGQKKIKEFALACERNQPAVQSLTEQLKERNRDPNLTTNQRIGNRYLIEYATRAELEQYRYQISPEKDLAVAELPIYDSWSPAVNEQEPFRQLVLNNSGLAKRVPNIAVLDVAAGRGSFSLFLRDNFGISPNNVLCVDLSPTSTARTQELGFPSITGDIKEIQINTVFDLIYLGYCIDRDNQPKKTLRKVRSLLHLRGVLILEGLLPVIPEDSLGTVYTEVPDRITKGKDLVGDAIAIATFVKENGDGLRLTAFALGPKIVRSLDGPELLSSSTFVFEREK